VTAFVQATLYGLLQGGLLALVAVGFSMVWGVMNVINVAQGAFVVLGAYIAFALNSTLGLDPLLGMFVAAAVLFLFGYAVQRGLINLAINAPIYLTLLLTFGLDLMLVQGMNIAFTADFRSIPTSWAGKSLALGDIRIPLGRLIAFGVAVAVTLLLVAMVTRTRTGLSIMATGMDRGAARLMGIRARHVYALTFGLAAALAGLAGAMVGTVGTFNPAAAAGYTLLSFVIAVLGGLGNMYGALVGGLVIGLVEAWAGQYLPGTWVNAFAFLVLILVLLFRPSGLVGRPFYASRVEV
jgi:branched-chain amino acid transport system permease protein